uniref:Leprecan-like alpha-helical domain-containing protein n=1 Tax=Caenorhabditis japonica TaxID=281687 RepID=A0A8R1E079_CAEJA
MPDAPGHYTQQLTNFLPMKRHLLIFQLFLIAHLAHCQPSEKRVTFEDYYQFGKNEYTDRNWPDCVAFMRRAIDDFRQFQDDTVNCRQKCDRLIKPAAPGASRIATFHETNESALCLLRCRKDMNGDHLTIRKMSTYFDMAERRPYQYMHICYYHQGELAMAVQSAYTFLVANPNDRDIRHSLEWYMEQPGYADEMLIDMERKDYEAKFINGVEAYDNQDWSRCVHEFETSLEKALKQDEACRILCQDKIDWKLVLNLLGRLNALHWTEYTFDRPFLFFKNLPIPVQRGAEAAQAVANYLLFDDNPLMRRNRYFYAKQFKKEELFTPSSEMLKVYEKREIELRYLNFMETRFVVRDDELHFFLKMAVSHYWRIIGT